MPYEPPDDLINLKVRWYAAQALCDRIAKEPATPVDPNDPTDGEDRQIIIQPRTAAEEPRTILLPTDEQRARLNKARAVLNELTLEIHEHGWKYQQDNRHKAENELNRIALERYEASLHA